jgi:hypothetical protein
MNIYYKKVFSVLMILYLVIGSFLFIVDDIKSISLHYPSSGSTYGFISNSSFPFTESSCKEYYFDDYNTTNWENPGYLVDGNINNPSISYFEGDYAYLNHSTYDNFSHTNITYIRLGLYCSRFPSGISHGANVTPVFNGLSGDTHFVLPTPFSFSWKYVDITNDTNAPSDWSWDNVSTLDCNITYSGETAYLYVAKITLEVYYKSKDFNVTRTTGAIWENISMISDESPVDYWNYTILVFPVSTEVLTISSVMNMKAMISATEVEDINDLTNNTFWCDPTNKYVHVRTINMTPSTSFNWSINCSYTGINFNLIIPPYLEVGQYFHSHGFISDGNGSAVSGMIAETRLLYSNGTDALDVNPKWNCTGGNYQCTFSTATLIPGIYNVNIEFTDQDSGAIYKEGSLLYLSYDTPDGVYSDAIVYFNIYNTNLGLGLPRETLKIYVDDQRLHQTVYYTYTGNTINVTVQDYYNQTVYANDFTITNTRTFLDLGITFHSWLFGNRNPIYYMISFLKDGATRWFERGIIVEREFLLPSGNYTMRIYDGDWNELHNSTWVVDRSRVYVIHGTNLSEIISGQSVIRGQLLELSSEIDYALMGDVEIIGCNPPLLYVTMNRMGMAFGNRVIKICPSVIVQAVTRMDYDGNWINSTAKIPGNDTIENGTIILLNDKLYISGPWNTKWVNITFSDNDTLLQNTSYIPNIIYLNGENITINGSHDLHIVRECEYTSQKKFEWNYYASSGLHSTGIDIINPMNIPIYNIGVFIEFSNHSNPDESTVIVRDHANDGEILERGVNYKVLSSGIEFYINNINASDSRRFTIEYYREFADNYYYGEEQVNAGYIEKDKVLNDEFYNYVEPFWSNDQDKIFRGGLLIKIDETKITEIKEDSVKIYDLDNNNILINKDDYIIGDTFIRISYDALGDIPSGGGRTFGIYFQEAEYPGADPKEIHLSTPIFHLGIPWTPFLIIFLVSVCGLIIPGVVISVKKQKLSDGSKILIGIGVFIVIISILLQNVGI